jgi:hypothetical protein
MFTRSPSRFLARGCSVVSSLQRTADPGRLPTRQTATEPHARPRGYCEAFRQPGCRTELCRCQGTAPVSAISSTSCRIDRPRFQARRLRGRTVTPFPALPDLSCLPGPHTGPTHTTHDPSSLRDHSSCCVDRLNSSTTLRLLGEVHALEEGLEAGVGAEPCD